MVYKITKDCLNCGACFDECPAGAIIAGDEKASIDTEKCTECGICVEAFFCPGLAIVNE